MVSIHLAAQAYGQPVVTEGSVPSSRSAVGENRSARRTWTWFALEMKTIVRLEVIQHARSTAAVDWGTQSDPL